MNTRYPSIYGGIETIVGIFTTEQVKEFFGKWLKGWQVSPVYQDGKVFDIFPSDDKEVVGYMTRDRRIRVHCINR